MPRPIALQTYSLDTNGHVIGPSGIYYRTDCFYAFRYVYTPPQHDQNHLGHVAVIGLRRGDSHTTDEQVLLFEENGLTSEPEAHEIFTRTLHQLGFEVWDEFP